MIRIGVAVERHAGGGQTVRALSLLPALVGKWRKPGGGILQLPLWAFPVNWGAFMHPELLAPGKRVVKHARATTTLAAVNSTRFADLGNAPTFSDTLVEVAAM